MYTGTIVDSLKIVNDGNNMSKGGLSLYTVNEVHLINTLKNMLWGKVSDWVVELCAVLAHPKRE